MGVTPIPVPGTSFDRTEQPLNARAEWKQKIFQQKTFESLANRCLEVPKRLRANQFRLAICTWETLQRERLPFGSGETLLDLERLITHQLRQARSNLYTASRYYRREIVIEARVAYKLRLRNTSVRENCNAEGRSIKRVATVEFYISGK